MLYRYSSCSSSCCWGDLFKNSLRLHHFKSDRDEIWRDCASSKYASISGIGYSIWHHAHFQDGGHDVTSRRKVLPAPSAECMGGCAAWRANLKCGKHLNADSKIHEMIQHSSSIKNRSNRVVLTHVQKLRWIIIESVALLDWYTVGLCLCHKNCVRCDSKSWIFCLDIRPILLSAIIARTRWPLIVIIGVGKAGKSG